MMNAQGPRRRLPEHVADAIATIIDCFWLDQMKDYLACDQAGQRRHIFNELLTVRLWLQNSTRHPPRGHDGQ